MCRRRRPTPTACSRAREDAADCAAPRGGVTWRAGGRTNQGECNANVQSLLRGVPRHVLAGVRRLRQRGAGGGVPGRRHRPARRVAGLRADGADDGVRASATSRAATSTRRCRSGLWAAGASRRASCRPTSSRRCSARIVGARRAVPDRQRARRASSTAGGFASNGYGEHSPGGYSLVAGLIVRSRADVHVPDHHPRRDRSRARRSGFAPIAIGLALTLIHLISIPVTNTSVNPARSTGPALFVGGWALQQLWLFWVAPIVGARRRRASPTACSAGAGARRRTRRALGPQLEIRAHKGESVKRTILAFAALAACAAAAGGRDQGAELQRAEAGAGGAGAAVREGHRPPRQGGVRAGGGHEGRVGKREAFDVAILTAPLMDDLAKNSHIAVGSRVRRRPLGRRRRHPQGRAETRPRQRGVLQARAAAGEVGGLRRHAARPAPTCGASSKASASPRR